MNKVIVGENSNWTCHSQSQLNKSRKYKKFKYHSRLAAIQNWTSLNISQFQSDQSQQRKERNKIPKQMQAVVTKQAYQKIYEFELV